MDIWEYYQDGSTFSKHSGTQQKLDLGERYIVMCVPRAFTPVCLGEIAEMEQHVGSIKDLGFNVVFISTDSPESWHASVEQDLDFDPSFPIGTVPTSGTPDGYFDRRTVWVVNNKNLATYQVPNYMSRSFDEILRITKEISEHENSSS